LQRIAPGAKVALGGSIDFKKLGQRRKRKRTVTVSHSKVSLNLVVKEPPKPEQAKGDRRKK